jgi:hypothetical protein
MADAVTRLLVSTAKCGHCKTENREPERLGRVFKLSSGRVNWYGDDPIWRRDMRRKEPDYDWSSAAPIGVTLAFPRYNVVAPESHEVPCKRHGNGRVPTSDVIGKRGMVWVTFKAPA